MPEQAEPVAPADAVDAVTPSPKMSVGRAALRAPGWRPVAAIALLLLVALAVALGVRTAPGTAVLVLEGRSNNVDGVLEIAVDGEKVYERELSAPERRALLRRIVRKGTESFETRIEVPEGRHQVAARLTRPDGRVYRDVVTVQLEADKPYALQVRAGRLFGSPLSIGAD